MLLSPQSQHDVGRLILENNKFTASLLKDSVLEDPHVNTENIWGCCAATKHSKQ